MTVPLTGFLHSYPGLFVTQAFFHSLVASFICEIALKAWAVRDPAVRQKVFLVPIVAPVVLFPLFLLGSPARGSTYFRLDAVFESGRWLDVEIGGIRPVVAGLVLVFGITSLVFLFQELIPILRNYVESGRSERAAHARDWAEVPTVRAAMEALPVNPPRVFVVEAFKILGKPARITTFPGWPFSLLLRVLKPCLSKRKFIALQFLFTAMQSDALAPKYGTHTLENFFKELKQSH